MGPYGALTLFVGAEADNGGHDPGEALGDLFKKKNQKNILKSNFIN